MKNAKRKGSGGEGKTGNRRAAHEAEGAGASGALAGAVVGAAAGPPGMVAGAIIGGAAGAITGFVLGRESLRESSRERALDAEIGVIDGELGAPNLQHPPAGVEAHSGTPTGVDSAPSDGPAEE